MSRAIGTFIHHSQIYNKDIEIELDFSDVFGKEIGSLGGKRGLDDSQGARQAVDCKFKFFDVSIHPDEVDTDGLSLLKTEHKALDVPTSRLMEVRNALFTELRAEYSDLANKFEATFLPKKAMKQRLNILRDVCNLLANATPKIELEMGEVVVTGGAQVVQSIADDFVADDEFQLAVQNGVFGALASLPPARFVPTELESSGPPSYRHFEPRQPAIPSAPPPSYRHFEQ